MAMDEPNVQPAPSSQCQTPPLVVGDVEFQKKIVTEEYFEGDRSRRQEQESAEEDEEESAEEQEVARIKMQAILEDAKNLSKKRADMQAEMDRRERQEQEKAAARKQTNLDELKKLMKERAEAARTRRQEKETAQGA